MLTSCKILQGLAPAFVGGFSDTSGRRPAYLACFVIYIAANIGLALQNNYAELMVLRCLQSAGSSGTVALSNAVVADIVTSQQRGAYVSYLSVAPQAGTALVNKTLCFLRDSLTVCLPACRSIIGPHHRWTIGTVPRLALHLLVPAYLLCGCAYPGIDIHA